MLAEPVQVGHLVTEGDKHRSQVVTSLLWCFSCHTNCKEPSTCPALLAEQKDTTSHCPSLGQNMSVLSLSVPSSAAGSPQHTGPSFRSGSFCIHRDHGHGPARSC